METNQPWRASYPESALNFTAASIEHDHLGDLVGAAALQFADRAAVSTQLPSGDCATLSYSEVDRQTDDFACYLRDVLGLEAGTPVALMTPNCIGFMVAAFGIFKAGCVCTNINPLYTPPEMAHQLKDSGAKVLVISDLFGDKADVALEGTAVEKVVTLSLADFFARPKQWLLRFMLRRVRKVVPPLRHPHVPLARALAAGAGHRARNGTDVDAYRARQSAGTTALYQYTGGTTGRSKGAELSHGNILANAYCTVSLIDETMNSDEARSSIVALPLYHITAFALVMVPSVFKGGHAVMVPSPRPPSNMKAVFENHPITHFSGINTLYAALLEEPWATPERLRHLKLCSSGGAAQQVAVAERWKSLTGHTVHQGYGLTECAGCMTLNPYGANRLGSAGVPIPLTEVRIVDDEGRQVPAGSPGEVVARGPTIMKGYLNRPEETAATLRDGWLHTGDIGLLDEDGYLQIVDRKKDMILVSGFNVYPNEIEDVIVALDGVQEVGVIGVPDEKTGEAIKAFVVTADPSVDAARILEHCAQYLTNYKRPRSVEFVAEIPKTPVGKVLRRALRELHQEQQVHPG